MTLPQLSGLLIRQFEGVRLNSYRDSGGVWTIGFGHTVGVTPGQVITLDQAVAFLEQDLNPLLTLVQGRPIIEGAALVDFGYNCGIGALKKLIVGEIQVNNQGFTYQNRPVGICDKAGNVLRGLQIRRQLEAALIMTSREDHGTA